MPEKITRGRALDWNEGWAGSAEVEVEAVEDAAEVERGRACARTALSDADAQPSGRRAATPRSELDIVAEEPMKGRAHERESLGVDQYVKKCKLGSNLDPRRIKVNLEKTWKKSCPSSEVEASVRMC